MYYYFIPTPARRQNLFETVDTVMTAISYLLLILFWSQLDRFDCDAVQINIDPTKSIATMLDAIHISCVPDNLDEYVKGVTFIELSRNDQDPLVFIPTWGNVSFGEDSSRFQAVANIHKDPSQSYLNVSLMNPESDDTGIYTCSLYYIDKSGHMKMEKASENLLVENIDVNSLEKVLNQLGDKITSLVKENKKSSEMITILREGNKKSDEMITTLGERVTSLEQENKDLKEKDSYNEAFFTTNKNSFTPKSGAIIVLPDVIWSIGTGYDNETGVFTAPVAGLYVFHVTVRTAAGGCVKELTLMLNDEIFSRLYDYSSNSWPQNSISSVLNIKAGDKVFLKQNDACALNNALYTFYTGYLLKPF